MKYNFGKTSTANLDTADPDLQAVMRDALATGIMDFSIIEGHRGKAEQNRYYDLGKSKVKYPDSKHNKIPSQAVDTAPYINGKTSWNKSHCCVLAGIILGCAAKREIKLRWGGCWSGDPAKIGNQAFEDLVHYEKA